MIVFKIIGIAFLLVLSTMYLIALIHSILYLINEDLFHLVQEKEVELFKRMFEKSEADELFGD